MTDDEIREKLADFIHEMWIGWMVYLFQHTALFGNDYMMDGEKAERWIRQMRTSYCDLPDEEKRSDRELADKLRKYIDGFNEEPS